jgi:mycothiol synthase
MNVQVLTELDEGQLDELAKLLARCEQADGHPALAEPQRAAAARRDLGGHGDRAVLAYDEGGDLIGCAFIAPAIDGATALHVAIDPQHREPVGGVPGVGGGDPARTQLIRAALGSTHGKVRLWFMQASDADDTEAARFGFQQERDLLQMRVDLPLPPETVAGVRPVEVRPFRPGQDDATWLTMNNQAFEGHPEQGGWTLEDLHERIRSDWFDPDGFLMADSPDGTGLIGSCWTKVHRDSEPVLGEIYVISVDPERHSQGWGRALTVAGLQWMAEQGIRDGMLYTTASNTAAVTLYTALGFTINHVDRSYLGNGLG